MHVKIILKIQLYINLEHFRHNDINNLRDHKTIIMTKMRRQNGSLKKYQE